MRRLLSLSAMILTIVSCDPGEWLYTHHVRWYIKNDTDRELTVEYGFGKPTTNCLLPGDSIKIRSGEPSLASGVPKCSFLWSELRESACFASLYSETGELLKRWALKDGDTDGHQLFNETCWRSYTKAVQHDDALDVTWVFDVTDEDIGLPQLD